MEILPQTHGNHSAELHMPAGSFDDIAERMADLRRDMVALHELAGRLTEDAPAHEYARFSSFEEQVNLGLEDLAGTIATQEICLEVV